MSPFATGFLVGSAVMGWAIFFMIIAILGPLYSRAPDLDEHADRLGIGGGEISVHNGGIE